MKRPLLDEKLSPKSTRQSKGVGIRVITRLLWRIIRKNKSLFLICSAFALLTAGINFFASLIVENFVTTCTDSLLPIQEQKISFLFRYFSDVRKNVYIKEYAFRAILYFVFLKGTFSIMHWYVTNYSSNKIEKDLKIELFAMLTNSSYEKSSEVSPKMLTQFSSDIDNIAYNIWMIPNRLLYVAVSIFLNVFFKSKKKEVKYLLVSVTLPLFVSLFCVIYFLLNKSTKLFTEAKRRYEKDNRFIFERIFNLEFIKSVSSEDLEKKRLSNRLTSTFKENQRSLLWTTLFRAVPDYLLMPNIPLLFIWIVAQVYSKEQVHTTGGLIFTAKMFIPYYFTVRRINSEVGKIFSALLTLEELSSSLSLVLDSVNFLAEGRNVNRKELVAFNGGDVIFNEVTFAYPSRVQNVVENFSFTFEKDKKYGIAGKNGIGKSTITKILLKLYEVSGGNVLINQRDLSEIDTAELHRSVCKLNNHPSFFNMSIAENTFYPFVYDKDRDLRKLIHAARGARISGFIKSLPAGFDTVLRGGGADLSEGQKQQLEAMRFFIRDDYQIYIFDEILSNVHPLTKKAILKNMFADIKSKLVIAIDHHYDIFTHMDYVYTFSRKKLTRIRYPKKLLGNPS